VDRERGEVVIVVPRGRVGLCESGDGRGDGGVVTEERCIHGSGGGGWRKLVIVTSASTSRSL